MLARESQFADRIRKNDMTKEGGSSFDSPMLPENSNGMVRSGTDMYTDSIRQKKAT